MKPHVPIELSDLVAEARSDGPSPEALSRLADEASARAAAAPVTSRSVGRLASRLGVAAVVSAAAFGILTAAGVFDTSSDSEPAPSATPAPAPAPASDEQPTVAQPVADPVVDDSTNVVPAVPTIDVRSLPAPQGATAGVKVPAAPPDDASEGALLRRAYAATTTAPRQALALTVEHARRFPTGVLAEEREVIAIEALAKLGRDDEARSRSSAFFAAHPGSAYRLRIDDALRKSASPAPSPRESHDP